MEIVIKENFKALRFPNPGVAVICYTMDQNRVLSEIGVVKEKNPHFPGSYCENLIMGTVESSDTSLLQRAMIELKEEGGLEIEDSNKWLFLGEIYASKLSPDPIYIFAVDVTGKTPETPLGDGREVIYSFTLTPIQKALEIGDSILISSFFKLFMKVYQKDFSDKSSKTV
jgi:8-oxo-dGTP pyrophosphatase MutT (NUDIX family)